MKSIFNVIRKLSLTFILLSLFTPSVFAADNYQIDAFKNKIEVGWEGKAFIGSNKNLVYWGNDTLNHNITRPTILTDNVEQVSIGSMKSELVYAVVKTDHSLWNCGLDENTGGKGKLEKINDNAKKVSVTENYGTVLKTDGTLWYWGWVFKSSNSLEDFDSKYIDPKSPVKIADNIVDFTDPGIALKKDGGAISYVVDLDDTKNVKATIHQFTDNVKSIEGGIIKNDNTLWHRHYDNKTRETSAYKVDSNVTQAADYHIYLKSDGTLWNYETDYNDELTTTNKLDSNVALLQESSSYIKSDKTLWEVPDGKSPKKLLDNVVNAQNTEGGLAITADGKVYSWGTNIHGQLGNGTVNNEDNNYTQYPPTLILSNLNNVSSQPSEPSQPNQPSNPSQPSQPSNPSTPSSDSTPIYRLYNEGLGEHLYTSDKHEYDTLVSQGWNGENVGWNAPTTGTPVYRRYNPALPDHLYTTDENEVHTLTTERRWQTDNNGKPLFYSGGSTPVYRLYHAGSLRHLLTKDSVEYNSLGSAGWQQEGQKIKLLILIS